MAGIADARAFDDKASDALPPGSVERVGADGGPGGDAIGALGLAGGGERVGRLIGDIGEESGGGAGGGGEGPTTASTLTTGGEIDSSEIPRAVEAASVPLDDREARVV